MKKDWLKAFMGEKSHVGVQFIKYGLAGGLASATAVIVFSVLNETVLPADLSQDGSSRGWNFFLSNTVAFVIANVVAYLANRAWVFQSGRHGTAREVILFFCIALVAFVIGTPLGSYIVSIWSISEYFVLALVIVLSAMVNFLGRKFVVFLH